MLCVQRISCIALYCKRLVEVLCVKITKIYNTSVAQIYEKYCTFTLKYFRLIQNEPKAIYFVPGMATDKKIFERIRLPSSKYQYYVLEWLLPEDKESLVDYVERMAKDVKHSNPILIGVSFGGVIVQEMAKIIPVDKTIIISSVKSRKEFPRYMRFGSFTKLYKLLTSSGILSVSDLGKLGWNIRARKRLRKMQAYFNVRDEKYLSWAIKNMVEWNRETEDPDVYHIHGTKDEVFPIKYIDNCRKIKRGRHAMILDKTPSVLKEILKIIEE